MLYHLESTSTCDQSLVPHGTQKVDWEPLPGARWDSEDSHSPAYVEPCVPSPGLSHYAVLICQQNSSLIGRRKLLSWLRPGIWHRVPSRKA